MTPTGPKEKADKGFAKFAGKGTFAERMMAKMGWKSGQETALPLILLLLKKISKLVKSFL